MPIISTHCPVSRSDVMRVTDLEGVTIRVLCGDYDDSTCACRLKVRAGEGGPLSRLIERAHEGTLAAHGVRCDLA